MNELESLDYAKYDPTDRLIHEYCTLSYELDDKEDDILQRVADCTSKFNEYADQANKIIERHLDSCLQELTEVPYDKYPGAVTKVSCIVVLQLIYFLLPYRFLIFVTVIWEFQAILRG
jgi:hypothetical protein